MSSKTAVDMRWHFKDCVKDGVLRHPAYSEAWKSFNQIHESFGMEPRNEPYVLMTLLIPGPKGPCHDIDVYMRPLIDELLTLCEIGVETGIIQKNEIMMGTLEIYLDV
ncbi:hypothetical protein L3X38_036814 [Prunus dulcis]|uniref:Uncharacterized protein n=1 Tax=Prunus dulcis TaxID=3755 RepID=A0AAD4YNX6_PRUDU|nr:hypothetical protein L3X38_036814 [Prunus dulcis]